MTIRLENDPIDRFLTGTEELGLSEEQAGRYNPTFTFFDQGYSLVQPSLESYNKLALAVQADPALTAAAEDAPCYFLYC